MHKVFVFDDEGNPVYEPPPPQPPDAPAAPLVQKTEMVEMEVQEAVPGTREIEKPATHTSVLRSAWFEQYPNDLLIQDSKDAGDDTPAYYQDTNTYKRVGNFGIRSHMIRNNPYLFSANPGICLLPGQMPGVDAFPGCTPPETPVFKLGDKWSVNFATDGVTGVVLYPKNSANLITFLRSVAVVSKLSL